MKHVVKRLCFSYLIQQKLSVSPTEANKTPVSFPSPSADLPVALPPVPVIGSLSSPETCPPSKPSSVISTAADDPIAVPRLRRPPGVEQDVEAQAQRQRLQGSTQALPERQHTASQLALLSITCHSPRPPGDTSFWGSKRPKPRPMTPVSYHGVSPELRNLPHSDVFVSLPTVLYTRILVARTGFHLTTQCSLSPVCLGACVFRDQTATEPYLSFLIPKISLPPPELCCFFVSRSILGF